MPEMTIVRFVLAVLDLKKSTDYYTSVLGLAIDFEVAGWSFLSRGNFCVMLGECTAAIPPGNLGDHSYYGYITVTDIVTLYDEYQRRGGNQKLTARVAGFTPHGAQLVCECQNGDCYAFYAPREEGNHPIDRRRLGA